MTDDVRPQPFYITLLRHGESVGNAESRWQGQSDFPLTDKGRAQARMLAERWQRENVKFDFLVTSPLTRARETAEIIASALNVGKKTVFVQELPINALITQLMEYANKARKEGILALQGAMEKVEDDFLKKAMQMAVDGPAAASLASATRACWPPDKSSKGLRDTWSSS